MKAKSFTADTFLTYAEMKTQLQDWVREFPGVMSLESIGKSPQGKDIFCCVLTNSETGAADSKPAVWIQANLHAVELTGNCSAMLLIAQLLGLTRISKKDSSAVSYLLDQFAFYVVPRIAVDGADLVIKEGKFLRSSGENWPITNSPQGFRSEDIDGNGVVLQMRVLDPDGPYKVSAKDSRVMIPRDPLDLPDSKQKFYRLLPEGVFESFDGFHQGNSLTRFGLDFNRQAPTQPFHSEGEEPGAGPFPLFCPETRCVAEALAKRKNVSLFFDLHTWGRVLLRPSSLRADSELNPEDLNVLTLICQIGEKATQYKPLNIYKDFRYDPKKVTTGAFDDWAFDQMGMFGFTPEIWNAFHESGTKLQSTLHYYQDPCESEQIHLLKWADKKLKTEKYFQKWKKFKHPQLGEVEIGGWFLRDFIANPPKSYRHEECKKITSWILESSKLLPKVYLKSLVVEPLGSGSNFKIEMMIANNGFLPTHTSQAALTAKAVEPPSIELKLSPKQKVISGNEFQYLKHLAGRSRLGVWRSGLSWWDLGNVHELKSNWVVSGPPPFEILVKFARGGDLLISAGES